MAVSAALNPDQPSSAPANEVDDTPAITSVDEELVCFKMVPEKVTGGGAFNCLVCV